MISICKRYFLLVLTIGLLIFSKTVYAQTNNSIEISPFTKLQKGLAFVGLTGGANTRSSQNENFLITNVIDKQKDGFNIQANGGYFLSKSFAIGTALRYDWAKLNQILEDSDGIQTFVKEAKSSLGGNVFIKNYIPITANGRFNLFNIVSLGMNKENKVTEKTSNDILTRYYSVTNNYNLGINPGIQVFIIKGFATEVGVNLAGLSHTYKRTTINEVEHTVIKSNDLDLKLNILSLNISFFYFFKS
ncbi:hypothetical protein [Flavobacterium succinicans]|uniref:Outer membrane protein beta-barrel domain-containing protein n=1 Tax=Flavobacterium succinicans TaxID=29536 RepID=A0A199XRQ4_9FLAO|nr:hypothetical protein [Flavobacterium succinicans]OAZ04438.1 hypothetical protein FLB_14360 [Flavobacterium succinicans]